MKKLFSLFSKLGGKCESSVDVEKYAPRKEAWCEGVEARRITGHVTQLKENEVFVFGSNLQGAHAGGAARTAYNHFGAVWGEGVGLHGQSYAIPTMQGGVDTIKPYVDDFIKFATDHSELFFYVTRIGCGIAGFRDRNIAPLFASCVGLDNVALPREFWKILNSAK